MSFIYNDYAERWAMNFQDPASSWMYAIIDLHDRIIFYLIIILVIVSWLLISSLSFNPSVPYRKANHGNL
jgi:cytochrome c oxidase subunit 2